MNNTFIYDIELKKYRMFGILDLFFEYKAKKSDENVFVKIEGTLTKAGLPFYSRKQIIRWQKFFTVVKIKKKLIPQFSIFLFKVNKRLVKYTRIKYIAFNTFQLNNVKLK